jgi:hypothetical protein
VIGFEELMRSRLLSALLAGIVLTVPGCRKAPDAPKSPAPVAPAPPKAGDPPAPAGGPSDPGAEELARALLDEARRAGPDEVSAPFYHQVCLRHPFTEAGREAAGRCVAFETAAREAFEREFQEARQEAEALRMEGRFAESIVRLRGFIAKTTKETLRLRAVDEISLIENEARRAYNDGVKKARAKAASDAFEGAAALLESAAMGSTDEVRGALAGDLATLGRILRRAEDRRSRNAAAAAEAAFRDRARRILALVKARKLEEALADLDAALKDPAHSPLRDALNADRAAVAAAAAFWDALQKNLKGRLNQEFSCLLADGKAVRGVLKRIVDNGITLQVEATAREVAFETLHPDQMILLAFGRGGLPEGTGESYAQAAMAFFLEGKDPLARLELATAVELGADVGPLESAWRRGVLRAALAR